jgi:hypothetical protein
VHVPPPVLALAARRGGALRELRLHGCQIRSLPNSAVAHLTALTSLQLSGNFFKALPEAVSSLTSLRDLDVSRNALASLCRGLGCLSALTSLDASSNQLLALPRCLSGLSGLRRLALSHNWLSGAPELGRMCGAWPYLTELRLANGACALACGGGDVFVLLKQKRLPRISIICSQITHTQTHTFQKTRVQQRRTSTARWPCRRPRSPKAAPPSQSSTSRRNSRSTPGRWQG